MRICLLIVKLGLLLLILSFPSTRGAGLARANSVETPLQTSIQEDQERVIFALRTAVAVGAPRESLLELNQAATRVHARMLKEKPPRKLEEIQEFEKTTLKPIRAILMLTGDSQKSCRGEHAERETALVYRELLSQFHFEGDCVSESRVSVSGSLERLVQDWDSLGSRIQGEEDPRLQALKAATYKKQREALLLTYALAQSQYLKTVPIPANLTQEEKGRALAGAIYKEAGVDLDTAALEPEVATRLGAIASHQPGDSVREQNQKRAFDQTRERIRDLKLHQSQLIKSSKAIDQTREFMSQLASKTGNQEPSPPPESAGIRGEGLTSSERTLVSGSQARVIQFLQDTLAADDRTRPAHRDRFAKELSGALGSQTISAHLLFEKIEAQLGRGTHSPTEIQHSLYSELVGGESRIIDEAGRSAHHHLATAGQLRSGILREPFANPKILNQWLERPSLPNDAELEQRLDYFFYNGRGLIESLDDKWDDKSPEDFVKNAIKYNPGIIGDVLTEFPEFSPLVCSLSIQIPVDQADEEYTEAMWTTAGLGLLGLMTLGSGSLFMGSLYAGARTAGGLLLNSTAGMIMSAGGMGIAAVDVGRYTAVGLEIDAEVDFARGLMMVMDESNETQIQELSAKARDALMKTVLAGALAPLDAISFLEHLKYFAKARNLKAAELLKKAADGQVSTAVREAKAELELVDLGTAVPRPRVRANPEALTRYNSLVSAGKLDQAVAFAMSNRLPIEFDRLIQMGQLDPNLIAALRRGNAQDHLTDLAHAYTRNRRYPEAAKLYEETGRYVAAANIYHQFLDYPEKAAALFLKGQDYPKAMEIYRVLARENSSFTPALREAEKKLEKLSARVVDSGSKGEQSRWVTFAELTEANANAENFLKKHGIPVKDHGSQTQVGSLIQNEVTGAFGEATLVEKRLLRRATRSYRIDPSPALGSGARHHQEIAVLHPDFPKYLQDLKNQGVEVILDSSLPLSPISTGAYYRGSEKIIALSADSTWTTFLHEYQHFVFDQLMTDIPFKTIKDAVKNGTLKELIPPVVSPETVRQIEEIAKLLEVRPFPSVVALDETLAVRRELETLRRGGVSRADPLYIQARKYAVDWQVRSFEMAKDVRELTMAEKVLFRRLQNEQLRLDMVRNGMRRMSRTQWAAITALAGFSVTASVTAATRAPSFSDLYSMAMNELAEWRQSASNVEPETLLRRLRAESGQSSQPVPEIK